MHVQCSGHLTHTYHYLACLQCMCTVRGSHAILRWYVCIRVCTISDVPCTETIRAVSDRDENDPSHWSTD